MLPTGRNMVKFFLKPKLFLEFKKNKFDFWNPDFGSTSSLVHHPDFTLTEEMWAAELINHIFIFIISEESTKVGSQITLDNLFL